MSEPKSENIKLRPGNRLRELRKAGGMTLEQLAVRAGGGMNKQNLSDIERGKRDLKPRWAKRFAHVLQVPMADLSTLAQGGLTEDERALIDTYRALPPEMRVAFDALRDAYRQFRPANRDEHNAQD